MLQNNIITALQILEAEQTIKDIISKKIVRFNIGRIRTAYRIAREKLNIKELSADQKLTIKGNIINDEISQEFKDKTYNDLKIEFENYRHIRNNIININDLSDDSVNIEKLNLMKIEKFTSIVNNSIKNNETFLNLLAKFKLKIYGNVNINKTNDKSQIETTYKLINDLYNVDTSTDDIEIITKFGYNNNIDYSHELSELIKNQNYSVFNFINDKKSTSNIKINNKITNNFLSYLFSDKITNNRTTLFPNTLNSNINYQKVYRLRTLGELLFLISNNKTKFTSKVDREQLYINYNGTRPKEDEYRNWNGMQVFDLDLKHWINTENGNINELKKIIHEYMIKYHWYLWVVKSSSGNGLHIYTKVAPVHHQKTNSIDNEPSSKFWYNVNYMTKLNFVYNMLKEINKSHNLFKDKNFDNKYVDNVVSRISAGIRLSYDENPYVNNQFIDMSLVWGMGYDGDIFNNKFLHDYESKNFYPDKTFQIIEGKDKMVSSLKFYRKKYKLIDDAQYNANNDNKLIREKSKLDLTKLAEHVKISNDLSIIKTLELNQINYFTRYNICNTLSSILGISGLQLAHEVLRSDECNNQEEINSFYTCGLSNRKEPTKLGLEILKKLGIVKSVSDELKVEIQEGFKNDLRLEIEKVLDNELPEIDFDLGSDKYLGDVKVPLMKMITGEKVNIVFSPAGSGKTELIKRLAKEGKRVLFVLPYTSVIKSKVEKDVDIIKHFDVFYGNKSIKDINYGRSAVTTFDKFSKVNFDKVARMFDYIIIDESHLLFTSGYRIDATSNAVKKIKELFYISNNDELAAKIILMTGTETGESVFFNDVANIIRVSKKQLDKQMEFVLCDDGLDAVTRMSNSASQLLEDGYRLLVPTNKGEIYSEKLIGMIEYILKRPVKHGYYKRSNTEQEICQLINDDSTIGDYEIIFCSNYLSVGVDINDKNTKFASLYMGDFAGFEIEQFNARVRKMGIVSKFFIVTETQNGDIYNSLITEPSLILKITDNDKLFFVDDKSIANAKQEFIAEYDPVLRKIITPGFSLLNGKIQFNLEEYELLSFENKYLECMTHPVKVARSLAKYGYNISVNQIYDGLDLALKNILKQTGIESAKAEKLRKHSLICGTFIDLIEKNTYKNKYGLEYNNVIKWILNEIKEGNLIEDRSAEDFIDIKFDSFASPQKIIVKSKEALEKIIGYAKYLSTRYTPLKSLEIFNKYVDANGVLKIKNFKRAINLLKLIDNESNNELSQPLTRTIEKIYDFVDDFETNKETVINYNTYQSKLDLWTNEYVQDLGIKINTVYGFNKIKDSIIELMMDICKKTTSKKGIRFKYNKLPDADSSTILNKRSIDSLITTIFKITENNTHKIVNTKHIILETQEF